MIKIYIINLLAALCTAWIVLFSLGFSAGFANYLPIAALLGSVLLLVIAAPLIIYFPRLGLLIGLIGCILMLPYSLTFIGHLVSENRGTWKWIFVLVMLPSGFVLLNTYFTVKALVVKKESLPTVAINKINKILFAAFPIIIFILYIFFYGRYWG
jgi:hypothetical protein